MSRDLSSRHESQAIAPPDLEGVSAADTLGYLDLAYPDVGSEGQGLLDAPMPGEVT